MVVQKPAERRRLHIMTWNAGGLDPTRYQELGQWLKMRNKVGLDPDIVFVQDTSWKEWLSTQSPATMRLNLSGMLYVMAPLYLQEDYYA